MCSSIAVLCHCTVCSDHVSPCARCIAVQDIALSGPRAARCQPTRIVTMSHGAVLGLIMSAKHVMYGSFASTALANSIHQPTVVSNSLHYAPFPGIDSGHRQLIAVTCIAEHA